MRTAWVGVMLAGVALGTSAGGVRAVADDEVRVPSFTASGVLNLPATDEPMEALAGRVVLLEFFAPWSDKCVAAVSHLNKLEDSLGGRGLSVLGVSAAEVEQLQPWVEEHDVRYAVAALDTLAYDKLSNQVQVPGFPHSLLLSPDGAVLYEGHPQYLKERDITKHLVGVRAPPPRAPVALGDVKELLDDGRWSAARDAAQAKVEADELDKISKRWAQGLVEWVAERRGTWLDEAASLEKSGAYWDAWHMYDDFPRRFEGMEGVDAAPGLAEAIRKNPAAKRDLEGGDTVEKVRKLIADGNIKGAKLVISRVLRSWKKTRHAERAAELGETLE